MGGYHMLQAQMMLAGMTRKTLADAVGIHYMTLSRKMQGKSPFTLEEALKIKAALRCSMPVEELFRRASKQ